MGATKIEWADLTFNPWHGCEKVSPACAHCYAEGQSNRFNGVGMWGAGHGFRFQSEEYWAKPLAWARSWPVKLGRRPRVFCASMADVFEERDELSKHRERLFDLIASTQDLDWLILTKRPEFARDWLKQQYAPFAGYSYDEPGEGIPSNVWLGVSIENARYTWRADVLREIPAAVRFISAEPLLGSLFERAHGICGPCGHSTYSHSGNGCDTEVSDWGDTMCRCERRFAAKLDLTGIDWVIAGGESGPRARPSHPDWFRQIRDACLTHDLDELIARPAFFFKQWGEYAPHVWSVGDNSGDRRLVCLRTPGSNRNEWVWRGGKKTNGRDLDGRTWDEFPSNVAVLA